MKNKNPNLGIIWDIYPVRWATSGISLEKGEGAPESLCVFSLLRLFSLRSLIRGVPRPRVGAFCFVSHHPTSL